MRNGLQHQQSVTARSANDCRLLGRFLTSNSAIFRLGCRYFRLASSSYTVYTMSYKVAATPCLAGASIKSGKLSIMPRKIRELIRDLERAGFNNRGGRGSHRNFVHPNVAQPVTLSGNSGDDAKAYQESAVQRAIEESES